MSQNTRNGDYDIAPGGRTWPPVSWSPKQNWHTSGAGRTGFGSAETDALIDNIDAEMDIEKRIPMVKELQTIIYDEQPEIYLISPVSRVIVHKRFEWTPSPMLPGFSPNTFKLKDGILGDDYRCFCCSCIFSAHFESEFNNNLCQWFKSNIKITQNIF